MTLEMTKGEARPASPLALPADDQSPPIHLNGLNDTRLRVPAELLPPDRARRHCYAIALRRCPNCGGYQHMFRSPNYAASYVRRPPCGGPELVLVVGSVHLRQVVA